MKNLRNVSSGLAIGGFALALATGAALSPFWVGVGIYTIVDNYVDNKIDGDDEDDQ